MQKASQWKENKISWTDCPPCPAALNQAGCNSALKSLLLMLFLKAAATTIASAAEPMWYCKPAEGFFTKIYVPGKMQVLIWQKLGSALESASESVC